MAEGPSSQLRWLTVAQAARALGITEQAVRRRVERGRLDTKRETQGNRVRTLVAVPVPTVEQPREDMVANQVAQLREQVARMEERLAAVAEARRQAEELTAAFRRQADQARADLERERQARESSERRQAEQDRRLDDVLRQLGELSEERHRPWPGLRRWFVRLWEGDG